MSYPSFDIPPVDSILAKNSFEIKELKWHLQKFPVIHFVNPLYFFVRKQVLSAKWIHLVNFLFVSSHSNKQVTLSNYDISVILSHPNSEDIGPPLRALSVGFFNLF